TPGTEPGDKFANVPRNQASVSNPPNQQAGSNSGARERPHPHPKRCALRPPPLGEVAMRSTSPAREVVPRSGTGPAFDGLLIHAEARRRGGRQAVDESYLGCF